jgi:enhancing lycopene biosynthesis protein 2
MLGVIQTKPLLRRLYSKTIEKPVETIVIKEVEKIIERPIEIIKYIEVEKIVEKIVEVDKAVI